MSKTKESIRHHAINWGLTLLLLIGLFIPAIKLNSFSFIESAPQSMSFYQLLSDNSVIALIVVVIPIVLCFLGYLRKPSHQVVHLLWVIYATFVLSSLVLLITLFEGVMSLVASLAFGYYLLLLILLALLVYNSLVMVDKGDFLMDKSFTFVDPFVKSIVGKDTDN